MAGLPPDTVEPALSPEHVTQLRERLELAHQRSIRKNCTETVAVLTGCFDRQMIAFARLWPDFSRAFSTMNWTFKSPNEGGEVQLDYVIVIQISLLYKQLTSI